MKTLATVVVAGVLAMAGCAGEKKVNKPASAYVGAFAPPTELTATLVDPINIDLRWKDNATNEAGYFVEYTPTRGGDFVTIDTVPPNTTSYRHPNLMPESLFIYRVRPFFGNASNVAEIMTGKEGPQEDEKPAWTPPAVKLEKKVSLRSTKTIAEAAPTNLTAKLVPPAGVRLAWEDHATDGDGYLVEIKQEDSAVFVPGVYLEPGTQTMITYGLPFETKFAFRVRAFVYGGSSNVVEKMTGKDPNEAATQPRK